MFTGDKNPQHASFGREIKQEVTCKILPHVIKALEKFQQKYIARQNS
jgi:hypothetical protein